MDNCIIAFGTFTGSTVPFDVKDRINAIRIERWKSFWIKALVVKQIHVVYIALQESIRQESTGM